MATNRIPNNDGGIQPTLVTAKGDLIGAVAAGTPSRVGVGTDGQSLTADSTNANGVSWQSLIPSQTSNSGKYLTTNGTATSWGTVATGSMTLLSTTTLSGATTTISSINGSYTNLYAVIYGVTNATGVGSFQCAPNGSTNITSAFGQNSSTTVSNNTSTYILLSVPGTLSAMPDNTSNINSWALNIYNYASASANKSYNVSGGFLSSGNSYLGFSMSGLIRTTSAITSLVFSNAGGNLSTGTVLLYGVN